MCLSIIGASRHWKFVEIRRIGSGHPDRWCSQHDDHRHAGHTMPKRLRLKRTPAEQAEHDLRKARKAAKKATSKQRSARDPDLDSEAKHSGDPDAELDFTFTDPGPST